MIVELYLAEPAGIMRQRAAVAIRARSLRSLEKTRAFGMTPAEGVLEPRSGWRHQNWGL